jgi:hypothetical protein
MLEEGGDAEGRGHDHFWAGGSFCKVGEGVGRRVGGVREREKADDLARIGLRGWQR